MKRSSTSNSPRKRILRVAGEWVRYHSKPPRILYHYTDAAGLLGMLKTRRLWATNSSFMNDPTEMEYAARVIRETTREEAANYPAAFAKRLTKEVEFYLATYAPPHNDEYVTCFCQNGDLLSQWRGYGALGGGYALGFHSRYLGVMNAYEGLSDNDDLTHAILKPVLRKVLYDYKRQKSLVGRLVRALFDWEVRRRPSRRRGAGNADADDDVWSDFNWCVSEFVNCFKDPAYSEEQEWRVIQYGRNMASEKFVQTHFRARGNRVVEYVELDASIGKKQPRLPLKQIRYGPTLDPRVTERGLWLLCQQYGYDNSIQIERSTVPFSG